MKCKKCGCDQFKIKIETKCCECEFNDAYDEDTEEYISNIRVIKEKDLVRDHALKTGLCDLGESFNEGCHKYVCYRCGDHTHSPTVETN